VVTREGKAGRDVARARDTGHLSPHRPSVNTYPAEADEEDQEGKGHQGRKSIKEEKGFKEEKGIKKEKAPGKKGASRPSLP
jgi:hypothetical protein